MKTSDYYSFLINKNYKIKIFFFFIILFSIIIVFADLLTIFSILPFTSLITGSEEAFIQSENYLQYFPKILQNFVKSIDIKSLFLILLSIVSIRNLLHLFNNFLIFKFIKYLEVDTSKKIYFLWLNKSYLDFYKITSSKLIKDFRDSIGGYIMFVENITRFCSDIIILIIFTIFLFFISFYETLIIFFYYSFIFLLFKKIVANFSFKFGQTVNLTSNKINLTVINTYKNFTQIILRKLKKNYLDLISSYVNKFSHSRLVVSFLNSNTKQFFEISLVIFIVIFVIFFNSLNIYSIEEIISLMVIFIVSAYRILPQINNLVSSLIKLKNFQFPFEIINDQIKFFNKNYKNLNFNKVNNINLEFKKDIQLKNIVFSYENEEKKIFDQLNLRIKKNETLGIVGKSGSGKTTIIKILLGLIKPNEGEIFVDENKIGQGDIYKYQSLFSYLSQENLFIPGSIKENIAFGEREINENKLNEALKITNCLEFVEKLDNSIDHEIIEDGKNFSIGQLQRLALARAVYFNNQILILDEPTSALDEDSEIEFLKLINKLKEKNTIIIISHKKETLKNCDQIYEVKNQSLIKTNF